jgi:predicted DNA repair protein MutK
MASSLLALLDDISTLLDDVSVLTKVAAKKTAGVLGDDLALNAQQVSGVRAERELPVVWAVAKGSLVNKAILVPAALAISAVAPWAVTPLLMVGGAYLCFEGMEKVAHRVLHSRAEDEQHHREMLEANTNPQVDVVAVERDKIKGAIRTDFILSAEIIVISLGAVAGADFPTRVAVLVGIALLMTAGVYGLVGAIVKLDDFGAWLVRRGRPAGRAVGNGILRAAPWLMKGLSLAGTVAMFLVGGSILVHGIPPLQHWLEATAEAAGAWSSPLSMLLDAAIGMAAGALLLAGYALAQRLRGKRPEASHS